MTGDRRIRLGVVLGLAGAVLALSLRGVRSARIIASPEHGPVLSDCDGAIRELVIQYAPGRRLSSRPPIASSWASCPMMLRSTSFAPIARRSTICSNGWVTSLAASIRSSPITR